MDVKPIPVQIKDVDGRRIQQVMEQEPENEHVQIRDVANQYGHIVEFLPSGSRAVVVTEAGRVYVDDVENLRALGDWAVSRTHKDWARDHG